MASLRVSVACTVACAFLLSACGSTPEGVPDEEAAPAVPSDKKSKSSEPTTDPAASEIADPRTVSAQSLLGDLNSAVGSPVATYPYISAATNQWSVSCNGGSSRDIAYVWRAPATGSFSFSTGGSNFDTVLQIRNYKATSEIMGCNDDAGSSLQSRITLSGLVRGTTLLIIIEGYAGEYGDFARLNITQN
jgi:hypothetical protein